MNQEIIDLLFPNNPVSIAEILAEYPARDLPVGAEVTRVAPSPTGFMHLGTLYMALISHDIAKKTKGKFLLRIEDTDKEREVEGARQFIIDTLSYYGLNHDEMYTQSDRLKIYQAFAKAFVAAGLAYPCFASKEELAKMREMQELQKVRPGYYGKYTIWRDRSVEDIKKELESGKEFVIRFRSTGKEENKILHHDQFFGDINLPENDEDFPILKSDGGTTYHFAHIIDDYLMGTTFVIRAEEWMASTSKHLSLWDALKKVFVENNITREVIVPKYGHIVPINKQADGGVRKLSKRKDPEASMSFYSEVGYPRGAVLAYLYRLANPDFDLWWNAGNRDLCEYDLDLKQMVRNSRGPLLDFAKLNAISSDLLASFTAEQVYERILEWSEKYDVEFANLIKAQKKYFIDILNIERTGDKIRKDLTKYSEARDLFGYFFDELYLAPAKEDLSAQAGNFDKVITFILQSGNFEKLFGSDVDTWVTDMKALAEKAEMKMGDFMKVIRVALTGRNTTPNMYFVLNVMGRERVENRLKKFL